MCRRIAVLLCLALLAVVPASSAHAAKAAGPKLHHFTVTFWEKRTTTWRQPAHNGYTDCYKKQWDEGRGSETVELKTRRPVPAIVYKTGDPLMPMTLVWNASDLEEPSMSAPLGGIVTRQASQRSWTEPGDCGGTSSETHPTNDCGTRLPALSIYLGFGIDRRLGVQIGADQTHNAGDHAQSDFRNCFVLRPKKDRNEWNPDRVVLSQVAFTNPRQRKVTLTSNKTYRDKNEPKARPFTTTSNVQWKIVFTRVR